ncbi:uncharacterized protein FYW61_021776 isoform 1-T1 [Anableps anableps]
MDKLKQVLGGQDGGSADGSGILERANQPSSLAWGTRMKGFLICFILGALCSILATCLLWIPGFGLPVFAVLYTLGNLCALASTMFLIGPLRQLKNMCAKVRALATVIMLVCLVLTLCAAFWVRIERSVKTCWFCWWVLDVCGSGSAVEEQRLGSAVLRAAVSGLHLVRPVLHPIRQGRCPQVVLPLHVEPPIRTRDAAACPVRKLLESHDWFLFISPGKLSSSYLKILMVSMNLYQRSKTVSY